MNGIVTAGRQTYAAFEPALRQFETMDGLVAHLSRIGPGSRDQQFALIDDRDRAYFGRGDSEDHFGYIEPEKLAVFGRSYAAEPDVLVEQLREDEAIAEADTLLLTVPSQLGVDYNAHVVEAILKHVAPALGWR